MAAFAIYRLPHASQCTLVGQNGVPDGIMSLSSLEKSCGFVIAPFSPHGSSPILLLRPDEVCQYNLDEISTIDGLPYYLIDEDCPVQPASRATYHDDFCRFHRAFSAIGFQKLVLARSADINHAGTNPVLLFTSACRRYPDAFVALFSAPQCGTWLIATPEVLLERKGDRWHTMALAGTMRYQESLPQWSEKNLQEQAYVAQYIEHCLDRYSDDIAMQGPYTVRAGILAHLHTDFSFTLAREVSLGGLLDDLHPTPAVCGLPKRQAHSFIIDNERCDRSYYSGFSGPLGINGDTAMFVSLRCMRIFDDRYRLYAGGGILPQSDETQEWKETDAKMQAMLSIIEEL